MRSPDFNHELQGFTENSRAFESILADLAGEKSYQAMSPKAKLGIRKSAQATFEAFIIFKELAPSQHRAILRQTDIRALIHDFHSPESRKAASSMSASVRAGDAWTIPFTLLRLTRAPLLQTLDWELYARFAQPTHEAQNALSRMAPDFNGALKGFTDRSRVFKHIMDGLALEPTHQNATASERLLYQKATRVAFESAVIFETLLPTQSRAVLRLGLSEHMHAFHSTQARKDLEDLLPPDRHAMGFAQANCLLALTRAPTAQLLAEELAQAREAHFAQTQATLIRQALDEAPPKSESPRPGKRI